MNRKIIAPLLGLLGLATAAHASVTVEIDAGILRNLTTTSTVPVGGLLMLVASPSGAATNFSAPTSTSFVSGDNIVVAAFAMNNNGGVTGEVDYSPTFNLGNTGTATSTTFDAGDPLLLRWFPTLTYAAYSAGTLTAPGLGANYGQGRSAIAVDGGSAWVTPANGSSSAVFTFITADDGGSQPNSSGLASNIVVAVPEPSTYAAVMCGLAGLIGVLMRRRAVRI